MIQNFKICHGIDIRKKHKIFSLQHNLTKGTVLNIIEKFHGTPIGKILSSFDQRVYDLFCVYDLFRAFIDSAK